MTIISSSVSITVADSVDDAPVYKEPAFKGVRVTNCVIVPRGTVQGHPTIDLVMHDDSGNRYVSMMTGSMLESIAAAVAGVRKRGMD